MNLFRKVGKWTLNVLIGVDQVVNAVICGDPDETISSRAGKLRKNKVWSFPAKVINTLFFWQKNHSMEAIEEDEGKDGLL